MGILDRVRRRHPSAVGEPVVHRTGPTRRGAVDGAASSAATGLVVGLHGYGATEHQFDTLLPIPRSITTIVPRAPFVVEPGYGWWLPEAVDGGVEFAPSSGIDRAVDVVVALVRSTQASEAVPSERTVLLGYSQGAALALTVAARHPELFVGVVTGAGSLVVGHDDVRSSGRPLNMLIMNGSLDPVVQSEDHDATVAAFIDAGHRVEHRYDPVPHVIDEAQARTAIRSIEGWLTED